MKNENVAKGRIIGLAGPCFVAVVVVAVTIVFVVVVAEND